MGGRKAERYQIYDSSKHVQVPRRASNCSSSKDIESSFLYSSKNWNSRSNGHQLSLLLETLSLENRGHNPQEL